MRCHLEAFVCRMFYRYAIERTYIHTNACMFVCKFFWPAPLTDPIRQHYIALYSSSVAGGFEVDRRQRSFPVRLNT